MKNKIIAIAAILSVFVLFRAATTQVPNILPISPIGVDVLFQKSVTIEGNLEVEGAVGGTTAGTGAFTSVTADSITVPILNGVITLDDTTTATILSFMTASTQHHIGCLTVSDMAYVKTLFLTGDAGSGGKSMRCRDLWYTLPIVEITGSWSAGTAVIKVENDTEANPKLPYGYLALVNNYTSVDDLTISGSTNNDGLYDLRQNATCDEVEGKETFIYIYPDAYDAGQDTTADGDVVSIEDVRYMVPTDHIFLAGRVSSTLTHGYTRGLIGEADAYDGAITKPQMCFGNGESEGGHLAGETGDIPGVFTAGKYVNVAISGSYSVYVPTFLYGVEVEVDGAGAIVDDVTIQFDIGGYLCEDYRNLKVLIAAGDIGTGAVSFHDWDGTDFDEAYVVPDGSRYIAGTISYWTEGASAVITLGESLTEDATIAKKILSCGNTDIYSGLQHIYGMFGYSPVAFTGAAGKYVSARCSQYNMRSPTYIYGVEIDE